MKLENAQIQLWNQHGGNNNDGWNRPRGHQNQNQTRNQNQNPGQNHDQKVPIPLNTNNIVEEKAYFWYTTCNEDHDPRLCHRIQNFINQNLDGKGLVIITP